MALRQIPQSRAQSPSPDLMAVATYVTSLSLILLHTMEMLMPPLRLCGMPQIKYLLIIHT